MAIAIAKVQVIHLMNADWMPGGHQPLHADLWPSRQIPEYGCFSASLAT